MNIWISNLTLVILDEQFSNRTEMDPATYVNFNFICIAPKHNTYYLTALETLNNLINWKKPPAEPDSRWAAICLDRLGWAGKENKVNEG